MYLAAEAVTAIAGLSDGSTARRVYRCSPRHLNIDIQARAVVKVRGYQKLNNMTVVVSGPGAAGYREDARTRVPDALPDLGETLGMQAGLENPSKGGLVVYVVAANP